MTGLRRLLCLLALLAGASCAPATGPDAVSPSPPTEAAEPALRFAVKGDWGAGTPEQLQVTEQMCRTRRVRPFEVVVTTGDNFSSPQGTATLENYFSPEACLIAHPAHRWRATWGNHDVLGESTASVLGAEERYYTWTEGPAQFFMLDSNQASDPAQQQWLTTELQGSQSPVKVAVFHHPPLTAGLHSPDEQVLTNWVPLFEEYGVDLVLNGHSHAYEHSELNGVHYVVTGGGGAPVFPCVSDHVRLKTCLAVHHFLMVEVGDDSLAVQALDTSGRVVDHFEIDPSRG